MSDHGLATYTDVSTGRVIAEVKMLRCVHCCGHFPSWSGSGNTRGWCLNCSGPICGNGCARCVHWEQMLENLEAGREANFKPIRVSVPASVR